MITEERFQKMTEIQWIFHYLETVAEEKEQTKYEIKIVEALFSVIKNNSEMIAAYTNPSLYSKMNQELQKEKMFNSDDMGKEKENIATVPTEGNSRLSMATMHLLPNSPKSCLLKIILETSWYLK